MYMVKFWWRHDPAIEKEFVLDSRYRGLKHEGIRPNIAVIVRKHDTDPIEPTDREIDERFRGLEYALNPVDSKVMYECEEAREQFEWRIS